MLKTPKLQLNKPEGTDVVNIADLNANMDKLDTEVTKLATTAVDGRMSKEDKTKLNGIAAGAEKNAVTSVAGKTGAVTLTGTDIPAGTTSARGTLQLSTSTTSTSTTMAATPSAVKLAMDKANEAFTQANDIKNKWANVIGNPLNASDTQDALKSKTQTIKDKGATNLVEKGVDASGSESLDTLINKIRDIETNPEVVPTSVRSGVTVRDTEMEDITSSSYYKIREFLIPKNMYGLVDVAHSVIAGINTEVFSRIYINGKPMGIERTTSQANSPTQYSEHFNVRGNDLVQLYVKNADNPQYLGGYRQMSIACYYSAPPKPILIS